MLNKLTMRFLAALLALVMVMGMIPMSVLAEETDENQAPAENMEQSSEASVVAEDDLGAPEIVYTPHDDYYNVISKNDYILAPGVTESEIVLNNDAGSHRQVAHVVEVDIHNPYTKVMPSYKGMAQGLESKNYGVQIMTEQVAYAEANGYGNVVAAMNISLSWYSSAYYVEHPELVGEPLGYLVMDGVYYENSQGKTSGAQTCLVINFDEKDGVARPDDIPKTEIRATSSAVTGWEEQVIPANFGFLVKDGVNQYSVDNNASNGASRSFVGIKADGSIVLVMNDGRQAPFSAGFTNYEMAEFMLSLGCVQAINGDGGGSSQFLSQRPGEEITVNCSPSDGTLRATTHGILVISTAPATGEFVRAQITAENDYYTPNSTVQFTAVGSDLVGTAADIPEDSYWRVTEGMGTIDDNGLFVSNGTVGEVTAELVYNEEVVGSATVNIVIPDTIQFQQAVISVPNGEYTDLVINAVYGVHEVVTKPADFTFALSDAAVGTVDGFRFTATSDLSVTGGSITATFVHDTTKTATAELRFGKASEIIWDFEDGTDDWATTMWKSSATLPYAYFAKSDVYGVNASNGKVFNGNGAMALVADFSYGFSPTWNSFYLNYYGEDITIENAQAIGCWLYIPDEIPYIEFSLRFYPDGATSPKNALVAYADEEGQLEPGWRYVSFDISNYDSITFKSGYQFVQIYYAGIQGVGSLAPYYGLNSMVTYYIDDVTIDYSTAVADREAPVFGTPYVAEGAGENVTELAGQTVCQSVNSFEVSVSDFEKDNAVGIDSSSAKVYIDGKEVDAVYTGGRVAAPEVELTDGVHTVTFEIADGNGNIGTISRKITVDTNSDVPTVHVVPHDATLDKILIGSVYYVDINATHVEKTDKVVVTLDLNNHSQWELDHMTVAEGFEASYVIDATDPMDKIATITITRVGESNIVGEGMLASLPIRTWEWKAEESPAYGDEEYDMTPEDLWADLMAFRTVVAVDNIAGELTLIDGKVTTFGADKILVDTEMYANSSSGAPNTDLFEGKDCWHEHTAESVTDVAATCTTDGYTGRTFCAVCNSVVDWGTTIPAAGHSFDASTDGLHTCDDCGSLYYYVAGQAQTGWIELEGSTYYFNATGKAANGTATVDGIDYVFENHVLTAPALVSDGVALVGYWAGKQLEGGWHTLNGNKYFVTGIYVNTGISKVALSTNLGYRWYAFDENGVWQENHNGLFDDGDEIIYCENGVAIYAGLVQDDEGNYYYINSSYKAVRNCIYSIGEAKTNGLLPAGVYEFGADGKMIDPPGQEEEPTVKQGLVTDEDGEIRYYVDGVATYAGLVQDAEGNYYYINSSKKAVKNRSYGIGEAKTNGLLPAGIYEFGADGKMIDPPVKEEEPTVKQGLVTDEDGEIRYYVDGVATYAGLVQDAEGNYYYINSSKTAVKNRKYGIGEAKTNGLLPAGIYEFGADGKMIDPPGSEENPDAPAVKNGLVTDEDGEIRYYVDGVATYAGLVQDAEGNYYYINSTKTAVRNRKYGIGEAKTNGLLPAGIYEFGPDGKMILN